MKSVAILTILVGLSSPAFADDTWIEGGKAAVLKKLNDPDSARFADVRVVGTAEAGIVCGRVNAKNRYGGYDGFKPFVHDPRLKDGPIIYGGGAITDDPLSQIARIKGFKDLCGR